MELLELRSIASLLLPRQRLAKEFSLLVDNNGVRESIDTLFMCLEQLVTGNLYVMVYSTQYPKGHLRGQIMCNSASCSVPPALPIIDNSACSPNYTTLAIYDDTLRTGWVSTFSTTSGNETINIADTTNPFCGTNAIKSDLYTGALILGVPLNNANAVTIDPTVYTHLEFYAKTLNGTEINLAGIFIYF